MDGQNTRKNRENQSMGFPDRYLRFIFKDIGFKGKKMIDIGAGSGSLSLYGIKNGLDLAVCVEPESSGSSDEHCSALDILAESYANLIPQKTTFQDYSGDEKFDIILLHNSVNHLDENAFITLKNSQDSKKTYTKLFEKLNEICAPNAKLIISDCDSRNFFSKINVRNPFAPTIEWNKHQSPEIIGEMLNDVGFIKEREDWLTPFNYFGLLENYKINKITAYFYFSYFRLIMRKI